MKMGPRTGIGLGIGTGYAPAKEKPFLLILSLIHLTQIPLSISSSSNDGLFFLRKRWYCWKKDSTHVWHRVPDGLPKHYRVCRDTTNGTGVIWYLQHCTLSSIASFSFGKQLRISSGDPRPFDHHLRKVPPEKHDPVIFILNRDMPYTLDTWRGSSWFGFGFLWCWGSNMDPNSPLESPASPEWVVFQSFSELSPLPKGHPPCTLDY